jgi:hypothetical protein
MLTHDKSSHGLWPGELNLLEPIVSWYSTVRVKVNFSFYNVFRIITENIWSTLSWTYPYPIKISFLQFIISYEWDNGVIFLYVKLCSCMLSIISLSVPDEGNSRKVSCSLNLISTFLLPDFLYIKCIIQKYNKNFKII